MAEQSNTLTKLAVACRKTRNRASFHPRYPEGIKQQVQELLKDGITATKISKTTGLSYTAIKKLSKREIVPTEPVRILPIVKDKDWRNGSGEPVLILKTDDVEMAIFSRRNRS